MDKTHWCVCVRCRTHGEVSHSLRRGTDISQKEDRSLKEQPGLAVVGTLQDYVTLLRANYAVAQFSKRISCLRRSFYLNRF